LLKNANSAYLHKQLYACFGAGISTSDNNSTAEGKELIAQDMALLNQRHLANMPLSSAD
jgi:hypothetical protein